MTVSSFSKKSISKAKTSSAFDGKLDGSTIQKAAPSAEYLRSNGITATGMYWILVNGTAKQVYCDLTTDGAAWYLLAYGANGKFSGNLTVDRNLYQPISRVFANFEGTLTGTSTGSIASAHLAANSTQMAISWNQTGFPNGNILSYTNAVKFNTPSNTINFDNTSLVPTYGAGFQPGVSGTVSTTVSNLQGSHGISGTFYTRATSFVVEYGRSYGLIKPPGGTTALDWGPDGQAFSALYMGFVGSSFNGSPGETTGYVTVSGTANGYTPTAMALWCRSTTV
jgi:hypothetical protein